MGTMRTLHVGLGARSYPIHVGRGLLARAPELLPSGTRRRAVVVTNPTVAEHWLAPLEQSLASAGLAPAVVHVGDGEEAKSLASLEVLLTRLLELRVERSTLLVALGGGVVGDLAGFAAAIYQRGIAFVQVPTTLLAQVDSSVGGKTGINHALGKNLIGAFWQPEAVLIDVDCLATLPEREFRSGLAEVIKYGAIREERFLAWIEDGGDALMRRDPGALIHAVIESCRIKAAIVAADERESGERALLNFGHTFGHAIEAATGYGSWLHGEAVAAGMVQAGRLSTRVTGLPAGDAQRLSKLIARLGLPVVPPVLTQERWLELMGRDKKVERSVMRFVLLEAIGRAVIRSDVSPAALAEVLA